MAGRVKFKMNNAGLRKIQDDHNRALRDAIRRVDERGGVRTQQQVYDELVAEIGRAIPNVTVDPTQVRKFAQAIADGQLEY